MLGLVFEVAGERYAVEARRVAAVVPRPELRAVQAAPAWVAGLFARGGAWVPVIDAARLIAGEPCAVSATSRVALIERNRAGSGGATRMLGLMAPRMTRVVELRGAFSAGLFVSGREFLGPIVMSDSAGVQLVDVDRLLPPDVELLLFGPDAGATSAAAGDAAERGS